MSRSALVALTCAVGAASALEITMPVEGSTLVADKTYTVEWDGTGSSRFEIDLYYCGSYCVEDDCGEWVTSLCPFGESGCPDTKGDYDIVMPEPMSGTSDGYKIRVMDYQDEETVDCSDEFTLMASQESVMIAEVDGPSMVVTSPMSGDMAEACMEYTVEWDYDDGFGSRASRFAIDLFQAEGSGDCGTYYSCLCDKEEIGCKDTQGDYDVVIPCDISSGEYRIRIGVFDDDSTYGCSDAFTILSKDGTYAESSMSYMFD